MADVEQIAAEEETPEHGFLLQQPATHSPTRRMRLLFGIKRFTTIMQAAMELCRHSQDKAAAQNYLNHLILQTLNPDLREVMTGTDGLLDATEKAIIAQHFHDGEDNAQIAHYLAGAYIGTAETMELQNGDTADYFVSTGGFEINIHDKFNTILG